MNRSDRSCCEIQDRVNKVIESVINLNFLLTSFFQLDKSLIFINKRHRFWEIEKADDLNQISSADALKEKIGFIRHPELYFQIYWTNIGDREESEHLAIYSIKKI